MSNFVDRQAGIKHVYYYKLNSISPNSENLCWAYEGYDPYQTWYTEEKETNDYVKANYDADTFELFLENRLDTETLYEIKNALHLGSIALVKAGHYYALVNPNWITTGFTISSDGVAEQCFLADSTGSMTIDAFRSALVSYCASEKSALDSAKQAVSDLGTKENYVASYQTAYDKAESAYESKKSELDKVTSELSTAQSALETDQAKYTELKNSLSSLKTAADNAKSAYESALKAASDYKTSAFSDKDPSTAVSEAQSAYDEAVKKLETAQAKLKTATDKYNSLTGETSETETKEMYRLYNPNSGENFYTASAEEKNNLVKVGWKYEGIGWYGVK